MPGQNEGLFEEFNHVKQSLIEELNTYKSEREKKNAWKTFLSWLFLWDQKLASEKVGFVSEVLQQKELKQSQKQEERKLASAEEPAISQQVTWHDVATFRDIYKKLCDQNLEFDKRSHWWGRSNNALDKILRKYAKKVDQFITKYRQENPAEGSFDGVREDLLKDLKKGYLKSREGFWSRLFYKQELTEKRKQIANDLIQILNDAKEVNDWREAYRIREVFYQKFNENKRLSEKYYTKGGYLNSIFKKHKDQFDALLKTWKEREENDKNRYLKQYRIDDTQVEKNNLDLAYYSIQSVSVKKEELIREISAELTRSLIDPEKKIIKKIMREEASLKTRATRLSVEWAQPPLKPDLNASIEEVYINKVCDGFVLSDHLYSKVREKEAVKDDLYQRYKNIRFENELNAVRIGFAAQMSIFYDTLYAHNPPTGHREEFVNGTQTNNTSQNVLSMEINLKDMIAVDDKKKIELADRALCRQLEQYRGYFLIQIKVSETLKKVFPTFADAVQKKYDLSKDSGMLEDFQRHKIHWLVKQAEKAAEIMTISPSEEKYIKSKINQRLSPFFLEQKPTQTLCIN